MVLVMAAAGPAPATAGPVTRFAEGQLIRTDREVRQARFPDFTTGSGAWHSKASPSWTNGFFAGSLWLAYERTGDPAWRRRAARRQAPLARQRPGVAAHDLGFIMLTSYGNGWRVTHRSRYRRVLLHAAGTLASLYSAKVGAIRSWGGHRRRFTSIVDDLMNIQLLFWAARHGGPRTWTRIARRDAITALRNQVRSDGSTYQIADYDSRTGSLIGHRSKQGASARSTWARGQGWAIYGLSAAYRRTHDRRLLRGARRVARWWLAHVPADGVPPWDFSAAAGSPRDSSAAAIAACGLLELARAERSRSAARRYRRAALEALRSLASGRYLATASRAHSILLHGTANRPAGNADTGLAYGDYYFLEGLRRARLDP